MKTKHEHDERGVMDSDLPGGNWTHGPRLEQIDGRYHTPAILEDATSIRGRLGLRAAFVADYLNVQHSHFATDAIATQLRRLSVQLGMGDAYVERADALDLDALREHGAEVNDGPSGLWVVVQRLDEVQESLEHGEDSR